MSNPYTYLKCMDSPLSLVKTVMQPQTFITQGLIETVTLSCMGTLVIVSISQKLRVRHLTPTVLLFNLYPVLMYFQLRVKLPYINIVKGSNKIFTMKSITFLNPISPAYSLKHWRHRFKPYLRINPCLFEQARLKENI